MTTPKTPGSARLPEVDSGRRSGRRRWAAAAAAAVAVAAAAIAAGVTGVFGGAANQETGSAGTAFRTLTTTVRLASLSAQTQVAATLGDTGTYAVVNQSPGTITALPAIGQIVRQGHVLYQVDGKPVILLYGQVPAYRDLSAGLSGPDVAELNADLVRLGYASKTELAPGSSYFSSATVYAVQRLQARLGVAQTGVLALGQAVFLPTAALITSLGQSAVLGGPALPGSQLLMASSTSVAVTIALDAALQNEVKVGEQVSITLPGSKVTPGVVTFVGTAAAPSSSSASGQGAPSAPGSAGQGSPTITVLVTPTDPRATRSLNQAPVEVTITTASVSRALVVPVDALLAQADGTYAVEVVGADRSHHLVAVSLGLFDDADGLVQVSGPGLAAGQRVVVPAI